MSPRTRPVLLAVVVALGAAGLLGAGPASAAVTPQVPVEAEVMRTLSGRSAVVADRTASAGRARVLLTNGTVATSLRATAPATRLVLRVRGDKAGGAPRAVVLVDGRRVADLGVSARTWTDAVVSGRWGAGVHAVQVRYVNDARTAAGDRNLWLDRVRFATTAPAPAAPAPAPAGPVAQATAVDDAFEARVVALVNAARSEHGRQPLAVSACADRYAEQWAVHLSGLRSLVHRTDLGAVMRSCGAGAVAENIAYGAVSPERLVQMWLDSPGHRANILDPAYALVGTGVTRTPDGTVWAAQNFLGR